MERQGARILVVEDDPPIRQGLLDVLAFNGFAPHGVMDGGEGLKTALAEDWDLILLDVMLPTMDGFSICRAIREKKPFQGIIILTAKGSEDDVVTGFSAGADDYVSKPFSLRELMVRVEAVLRRAGRAAPTAPLTWGDLRFDGDTLTAAAGERTEPITRREMDIIAYLRRRQGRIVSKRELLLEVWRYADADIETRTVDIHMLKLRRKIAGLIGEKKPFITTVRGEGYRMEPSS